MRAYETTVAVPVLPHRYAADLLRGRTFSKNTYPNYASESGGAFFDVSASKRKLQKKKREVRRGLLCVVRKILFSARPAGGGIVVRYVREREREREKNISETF